MRDVGMYLEMARERVTIVDGSRRCEVAAARESGYQICGALSSPDVLEAEFPKHCVGTLYTLFAEATEDLKVSFVGDEAIHERVIYEAALGMMDNGNALWR